MRWSDSIHAVRCVFGAVLLTLAPGGCYKASFITTPNVVKGQEHDQWNSFFLWGLVGEETLDVRQFCPGGQVAQVRTGANFLTGLVSFVTLGIYAPRMSYVWCAAGYTGGPPPAPQAAGAAGLPENRPTLAIYGDRQGRPVRVELRRGRLLEAVAEPKPIDNEHRAWRVGFASEQVR